MRLFPHAPFAVFALAACGGAAQSVAPREVHTNAAAAAPAEDDAGTPTKDDWAALTRSPNTPEAQTRDDREIALAKVCGTEDAALLRVAREIAEDHARGLTAPDDEGLVARLRRAGDPHVRPRLFVASGHAPIDEAKIAPSLQSGPASACGVAFGSATNGDEVFVAVRAETLADLAPLPTQARTGQWLTLEARLRVPARSAKLVVLGPRGLPRFVPTSLDPATGIARARFALDSPGAFTVQLLGELADGPRPLLEARVFADRTPSGLAEDAAPGEEQGADDAALARMIASARAFESAPPLARDPALDAFARAHVARMRERRAVAHDLGDGDFKDRYEAEGTAAARAVGENVVHAPSVALAHRALYASPSHRMNLLRADYTHFGVAIARAEDGSVYACETFVSRTR